MVNLRRRICGYMQWEITRILCLYAFSAVLYDCENLEDYLDEYYMLEMYKKANAPVIYAMPSKEQWIKINHDHLEPPKFRMVVMPQKLIN
jgi:hypothetical protein